MDKDKVRLKVMICGKEYVLYTEEEPAYVYALAKKLEKCISEIVSSNINRSPQSAAVMIALSTLDEINKCNIEADELRNQIKEYADENSRLQKQISELEQKLQKKA